MICHRLLDNPPCIIIITPHVHARAGLNYVFRAGVHLYIYVCDPEKSLHGTLAVDFQTLVVDFSSNVLTSSTTARSRNGFLVEKIKDFLI